jgi:hypothetical protein
MANHDDDREVFEPGFRAWSLMSTAVRRLWLTAEQRRSTGDACRERRDGFDPQRRRYSR